MAIGDRFSLTTQWYDSSGTNVNENVFHFTQASDIVLSTPMEDLYDAWITACADSYAACVSGSLTLVRVVLRTLTVPPTGVEFSPSSVVGTLSGAQNLPRQIAPLISWKTAFLGKSFRGRTYMPTVTEEHCNDGVMDSTYQSAAAAFADDMLGLEDGGLDHADWNLIVWSPTLSTGTKVTSYVVRPIVGVQRRRKFGVGA